MTRTSQHKISVIVPVYNTEKYLEQCLDSLLSQTYKNLEIICVDDGSSDNSLEILEKYKKLDSRIIVIAQENQGQSASRNKGLELATGNWITFVDSDDWVDVECYEEFSRALKHTDFDIFMFNGASFKENENNPKDVALSDFFFIENWKKASGEICTFKDCKSPFEGNLSVYNKIYRRNFIEKLNLKFEKYSLMEDELYWIEAFLAAKAIYLCNKIMYFYRQQKNSTLHTLGRNVFDIFSVFDKVKEKLVKYDCFNTAKYAFLQHKFRQFAFFFFAIPEKLRGEFFENAKISLTADLEEGYSMDIIQKLIAHQLLFGFLNLTSEGFYDNFKSCVRM